MNVNDTRMATTVNVGRAAVATIEHLMSAFSGLGVDNCLVEVNAPEIPVMDGSGAAFVYLIHSAGLVEQKAPRRFVRILKPVEVREGSKLARLEPHEGFRLSFRIAFGHPAIDATDQYADIDFSKVNYEQAVSRCRTFGFVQDVEMLRKIGLAQGGSLSNAIVMDEFRVLNPGGLREQGEFVKHKILDAMGDLYVLGAPLLAHYIAEKSGHGLNNQLLRALLADPSAFETVTFEHAKDCPVDFGLSLPRFVLKRPMTGSCRSNRAFPTETQSRGLYDAACGFLFAKVCRKTVGVTHQCGSITARFGGVGERIAQAFAQLKRGFVQTAEACLQIFTATAPAEHAASQFRELRIAGALCFIRDEFGVRHARQTVGPYWNNG